MISELRINGERLWDTLDEMAAHGLTDKGGSNRQALTDEDKAGRDLFVSWCEAAGCQVRFDEMGNIFARRPGVNNELPPVITGSHLDTQPTGGRFDGVYGVLAGLEVIRTLEDAGVVSEAPVEVVVWTNEEGARFPPAMMGSGVWAGVMDRDKIYDTQDKAGKRFEDELIRIGYRGDIPAIASPIKAAFEVHIEQGPILEAEGKTIGVLTGVQGVRWYDLIIGGEPCHAGPTPMESRKDPFMGALPILQACYELAEKYGPDGRVTFGDIQAQPGSRNTVPEKLIINVDLRHPDADILDKMDAIFREKVISECDSRGLTSEVNELWHMPVTKFDGECINTVRSVTEQLGYSYREMVSGAGHDSLYVAKVVPTSMIFVPCENGISHNEKENADINDLAAGCNVLLHSILDMAL